MERKIGDVELASWYNEPKATAVVYVLIDKSKNKNKINNVNQLRGLFRAYCHKTNLLKYKNSIGLWEAKNIKTINLE